MCPIGSGWESDVRGMSHFHTLLPALIQIDVFSINPSFYRFLGRLPTKNRLEVINMMTYGVISRSAGSESVLPGPSMSALRVVNIRVLEKCPDGEALKPSLPWVETVCTVELEFSGLHYDSRGLLSVKFVPLYAQVSVQPCCSATYFPELLLREFCCSCIVGTIIRSSPTTGTHTYCGLILSLSCVIAL
jgi:hypothetical protein